MSNTRRKAPTNFEDPLKQIPRALTKLYSEWVKAVYPFASKGRKLSVHYTCDLRNPALMEIGHSVIVHQDVPEASHLPSGLQARLLTQ
jgi:hypothetical protein